MEGDNFTLNGLNKRLESEKNEMIQKLKGNEIIIRNLKLDYSNMSNNYHLLKRQLVIIIRLYLFYNYIYYIFIQLGYFIGSNR